MAEFDRIDRRILTLLQADGRISTVDLAERIGLSPTSTSERVKRLQREGFVSGFRAVLDPRRLGL
ncbi:MAG TPA: winged helix-turn-helix transcriptional regulator, partial [Beijerinckiaceae bacterium]|nr:winged helix-turn-helix transcriptional regulator [Beijerinckiaceae bacterium]